MLSKLLRNPTLFAVLSLLPSVSRLLRLAMMAAIRKDSGGSTVPVRSRFGRFLVALQVFVLVGDIYDTWYSRKQSNRDQ